jgi:hypothetical protein
MLIHREVVGERPHRLRSCALPPTPTLDRCDAQVVGWPKMEAAELADVRSVTEPWVELDARVCADGANELADRVAS